MPIARASALDDGFADGEIERIFDAVPVATHNQRGIGQLHLGAPEGVDVDIDARDLLHIVTSSMSSEIYELMKRSDESAVVEKAHRNPRFVEDVVREMVRNVADEYPQLRDGGFMVARQENLETIHRHTVIAERTGLVSEVLDEIETGTHSRRHASQREWLEEQLGRRPRDPLWLGRRFRSLPLGPRSMWRRKPEEVVGARDDGHGHRGVDQDVNADRRRLECDQAEDRRHLEARLRLAEPAGGDHDSTLGRDRAKPGDRELARDDHHRHPGGRRSRETSETSAAVTSSLSASGSISLPNVVSWRWRRAI